MKLTITSWDSTEQKVRVDGTVEYTDGELQVTGDVRQFVDHYRNHFLNENDRAPTGEELLALMRKQMANRTAGHAYLDDDSDDPNAALLD
jgi:hypothetical protein